MTKTDTNEGLQIWNELEKTDPEYTKQFSRAGGFKGTAINAMYAVKKMTEKFGPMGKGWGIESIDKEFVPAANDEVLIFVQVALWWGEQTADGKRFKHIVGPQWGGDRVVTFRAKDGTLYNDDEAMKKATTDGMLKCMSLLGIGSDLHLGMYDDSKYVAQAQREFDDNSTMPKKKTAANPTPTGTDANATPAASGSEKPSGPGMTKMPEPDKAKEEADELAKIKAEVDGAWGIIQALLLEKHAGDPDASKKEAQAAAGQWLKGVSMKDTKAKLTATRVGQSHFIVALRKELKKDEGQEKA